MLFEQFWFAPRMNCAGAENPNVIRKFAQILARHAIRKGDHIASTISPKKRQIINLFRLCYFYSIINALL